MISLFVHQKIARKNFNLRKKTNYVNIMKSTLALAVLLFGFVCLAAAAPPNFDKINIDTVLKNEFVLRNYINCLLDQGKCSDTGREIKRKCFSLFINFSHRNFVSLFGD